MIGIDRVYHQVKCKNCKESFYVYEQKDYLMAMDIYKVLSETPVDKLKPLCSHCKYCDKSYYRKFDYLHVYTKVEML